MAKLRTNKRYRYEKRRIVIAGQKIVDELPPDVTIHTLLVGSKGTVAQHLHAKETVTVPTQLIEKIMGYQAAPDLVAEIDLPEPHTLQQARLVVALDQVSDPGNVGTIARTALALGWEGLFFLQPTVDPFNDKALRAARGALFHLPYRMGNQEELLALIKQNQLSAYVAVVDGEPLQTVPPLERALLILGNESRGPAAQMCREANPVTIPMNPNTESLNVASAGAILLYALKR